MKVSFELEANTVTRQHHIYVGVNETAVFTTEAQHSTVDFVISTGGDEGSIFFCVKHLLKSFEIC